MITIVKDFTLPSTFPLSEADWKAIGEIGRIEIGLGIDQQVDVTGKAYAPLKPNTIASKRGMISGPGAPGRFGTKIGARASVSFSTKRRPQPIHLKSSTTAKPKVAKTGWRTSAWPTKRLLDSGNLRDNVVIQASTKGVRLSVGPTRAKIGSWMQNGTEPHTIKPVKAKRLAFITTSGLTTAKSVKHPGTPATPYFGISQRYSVRILEFFDRLFDRWLKEA